MARINGASSARAGLYVKIAYHFTRRSIAKLTGRQTERMIEPLFDKLRQHLDDGQIVELTHHIALENMRGRFNVALGIGSAA